MKFNTKLVITFVTILVLPIVLACIAYLTIGMSIIYSSGSSTGNARFNFAIASDPVQASTMVTSEYYDILVDKSHNNRKELEEKSKLEELDLQLQDVSSFLMIRKGDILYYVMSSNHELADRLFSSLPRYGVAEEYRDMGYYYSEFHCMVKQVDFQFEDGSEGSAFLVTRVNMMLSENLLNSLIVAFILVLLLTSILLTAWIRKSVFLPLGEVNAAMQRIAAGNFTDSLKTDEKGEIGELYENFEQMRLQLKESSEEKILSDMQSREMISNISHDLKTPVTSIKGYVEGIMDGIADSPEKMDKYIKTIYNKANDMDRLIDELTVYSRIDSNKMLYNFHNIDAIDYFGDCAEEVGLDLEARGIEFEYDNSVSTNTLIIADPEQLKRVINNIIHNSVKYSDKEKAQIGIKVSELDDAICVEISDNGKGIAKEDLEKIFERFFRTDASRNSRQGGSGIGLSIAKKIVEDHGGNIWATGDVGVGITIHFTLRKFIFEELTQEDEMISGNPIAMLEQIVKKTGKKIKNEATKSIENWNIDKMMPEGRNNSKSEIKGEGKQEPKANDNITNKNNKDVMKNDKKQDKKIGKKSE